MVALADPVEVDDLVAHEHLSMDHTRHLVAGVPRIGVDPSVGLPLEVETERHPIASKLAVVDLERVVDPDRERLGPQREVLERRLDRVIGPEPFRPDLE